VRAALKVLVAVALAAVPATAQDAVRRPAVAGSFYPDDAHALRASIDAYLVSARPPAAARPIALIVPHAGYVFSGQIAADAYRQAQPFTYETIVVLGANHTEAGFDGIALFRGRGFRTPLGIAAIHRPLAAALKEADPEVAWYDSVHKQEHAIEVQLPFIQRLFPAARILPIVVGTSDSARLERLGTTLARLLEGQQALIVASSDLSHYPSAAAARVIDGVTLEALATLDPSAVRAALAAAPGTAPEVMTGACGEGPILVALAAARALGATRARVVSYANSADSPAGNPSRVVGYGAVAFDAGRPLADSAIDGVRWPDTSTALSNADHLALVTYARQTIDRFVTTGTAPLARGAPASLLRRQGVFVTLKKGEHVRGCIGRVVPDGPLYWLVGATALRAAVGDSRFKPVRPNELDKVSVEISLLTPPRAITSTDDLVLGRDGLVLIKGDKSAVFLPEVATDEGWDRDELLDRLRLKAGLDGNAWRQGARLFVFQTVVIKEEPEK
jgi:AmmeMemoRadiSam system protein B/AmmeMemoRadiSam system protein A